MDSGETPKSSSKNNSKVTSSRLWVGLLSVMHSGENKKKLLIKNTSQHFRTWEVGFSVTDTLERRRWRLEGRTSSNLPIWFLFKNLCTLTPGDERPFGQGFLSQTSIECFNGGNLTLSLFRIPRRNKIQCNRQLSHSGRKGLRGLTLINWLFLAFCSYINKKLLRHLNPMLVRLWSNLLLFFCLNFLGAEQKDIWSQDKIP